MTATTQPVGMVPRSFNKAQQTAWRDVLRFAPADLVQESDRLSLEVLACLLADFRSDPGNYPASKLVRLETLLSKFALTPKDRLRIEQPAPIDDLWSDI